MTQELLISLIQFSIKFGLDATLQILNAMKEGATIDDAIAAWDKAAKKTAQQYLDEAKEKITPTGA